MRTMYCSGCSGSQEKVIIPSQKSLNGDKEVCIHNEVIRKAIRKMATNKKIEFFFLHNYFLPIRFQNITGLLVNLIKQIVFLGPPHGFSSPVGYGNEAIVKNIIIVTL